MKCSSCLYISRRHSLKKFASKGDLNCQCDLPDLEPKPVDHSQIRIGSIQNRNSRTGFTPKIESLELCFINTHFTKTPPSALLPRFCGVLARTSKSARSCVFIPSGGGAKKTTPNNSRTGYSPELLTSALDSSQENLRRKSRRGLLWM